MGATTAADLAAGSVAMIGTARYTYEPIQVFKNTANVYKLGKGEKSIYIPKFGTITCEGLTDGVDMANSQTMTINGTTHTTNEAGCKVIVTKKLRAQLKEDAYRAAGKVIGNAMGKKMDVDGLTLYSGLDSGLSNANTSFGLGYAAAAVTQCIGQAEPAPMPMAFVLHPYQLNTIVDAVATPGTSNMPPEYQMAVLQNHFAGIIKMNGVPVFHDANISIDSSDDAYGAVYSKEAFIYVVGWEPDTWLVYDDSLRGWEIGIVADYAMVEEDGTYGRRYLPYSNRAKTGKPKSIRYGNPVLNKMCRDYTPDSDNTEEIVRPCRKLQEAGRNDQSPLRRSNNIEVSLIRCNSTNQLGDGDILWAS